MIVHLTTVHSRNDVRIFHKEIKSISKIQNVVLLICDGQKSETIDNIQIINVGIKYKSRTKRFIINSFKILRKALNIDAQIYHFHDPELMIVGLFLKLYGKKVIYDVHEDLPRQIQGKPYLNKWIKPILSWLIEKIENFSAKRFDFIIAATPFIKERFLKINKKCIDINNYPIQDFKKGESNYLDRLNEICYLGGISEIRGVYELIESLEHSEVTLNLAGDFKDEDFKFKCKQSKGWNSVIFHGYVDRNEINNILNKSKIGLVTLYPLINYLDSLPVKMFEYMSAGIPVIASDFSLWKKIIEGNNCGICVDPKSPKDIRKAVSHLLCNPEIARIMGQNGLKAVENSFNWNIEELKLLEIYNTIINKK